MFNLLLVAAFTAFFLAMLEPLIDVLSVMFNSIVLNSVSSLALSWLGNYLVGTKTIKGLIIQIVAGAFLGRVLLRGSEKVTTYRPTIINQAR
jgi:hypothetical protein